MRADIDQQGKKRMGKNMKKTLIAALSCCIVFLAGTGTAAAQDNGMLVIPVELFACSFKERQGPDNLDRVIARWNAWADRNAIDTYAAWTLTPYYYGPQQDYDVLWLGAGKDAVAMGRAQDTYLNTNDGIADAFEDVIDCSAHGNFASINFKAPPEGATPRNSVLSFSDCSYRDGATFTALGAAMAEWSQYLADRGSATAIFHWYPVYGGGGEEYDFKWLEAFDSLESMGKDYEILGNGGAYVMQGRLFSHLIDCDSARVYLAENRRFTQLR